MVNFQIFTSNFEVHLFIAKGVFRLFVKWRIMIIEFLAVKNETRNLLQIIVVLFSEI